MPIGDWALQSDAQSQRSILAKGEAQQQGYAALGQGISGGVQGYMQAHAMVRQQQQQDLQNQLELQKFGMEKEELQWKMGVTAAQQQMQMTDHQLRATELSLAQQEHEWKKKQDAELTRSRHSEFIAKYGNDIYPDPQNPEKFYTFTQDAGGDVVRTDVAPEVAKQVRERRLEEIRAQHTGVGGIERLNPQLKAQVDAIDTEESKLIAANKNVMGAIDDPKVLKKLGELSVERRRLLGLPTTEEASAPEPQKTGFYQKTAGAVQQFTDTEERIMSVMRTPTVSLMMQHKDSGPAFTALLHQDVQGLIASGKSPEVATQYVSALLKSPEGVADYLVRIGYREDQIVTYLGMSFPRMEMDASDVAKIAYGRHNEKPKTKPATPEETWQKLDALKKAREQQK